MLTRVSTVADNLVGAARNNPRGLTGSWSRCLVEQAGLEPATTCVSGMHPNQLGDRSEEKPEDSVARRLRY